MCTPSSIILQVQILFWVKLALGAFVLIQGLSLASDVHVNEAFGTEFRGYGTGLFVMGLLSVIATFPHRWATQKHNRFGLALTFLIDTVVVAIQAQLGATLISYLTPEFPKDLQLDCLLAQPLIYTKPGACSAFLQADRTAGLYLYWKWYYTRKNEPLNFQRLNLIQGDTCCGFNPPFTCIEDPRPFPANRDVTGVEAALASQRVTCGAYPGYYPQQDDCIAYFDLVKGIVGGCEFDLGVGPCLLRGFGPTSSGCASAVEDYVVSSLSGTAFIMTGAVIINVFAMLLTCCMWWKRKAVDVFPADHMSGAKVNWDDVKFQFEIKPLHNVLVKKGFLPDLTKKKRRQEGEPDEDEAALSLRVKPPSGAAGSTEAGESKDEGAPQAPAPAPSSPTSTPAPLAEKEQAV